MALDAIQELLRKADAAAGPPTLAPDLSTQVHHLAEVRQAHLRLMTQAIGGVLAVAAAVGLLGLVMWWWQPGSTQPHGSEPGQNHPAPVMPR